MKLENLNKEELIILKEDIDNKLKEIERNKEIKKTKPKKDSILSLQKGDKIFAIRLSFGPHRLVEDKGIKGEVDIIDYCTVEDIDLRGDSDDFRINISNSKVALGISTTLLKEEYGKEHCLLSMDTNKSGYDAFYTLKPDNWKDDLKRVFDLMNNRREKYFLEDSKIFNEKLNIILNSEKKINKFF
jgi:hypothetical protein